VASQWQHYSRHKIDIVTDHKNLEYFSTTKILTRRQARWSEFLSAFDMLIRFRPGKLGEKPDALTRCSDVYPKRGDRDYARVNPQNFKPVFSSEQLTSSLRATLLEDTCLRATSLMDYKSLRSDIVKATDSDTFAREMIKTLRSSSSSESSHWTTSDTGLLFHDKRIYVPDSSDLRLRVLRFKHDHPTAGHPGQNKTIELLSREFYWPGYCKFVQHYCKSCTDCGRNKARRHKPYGKLKPLPIPQRPWDSILIRV